MREFVAPAAAGDDGADDADDDDAGDDGSYDDGSYNDGADDDARAFSPLSLAARARSISHSCADWLGAGAFS